MLLHFFSAFFLFNLAVCVSAAPFSSPLSARPSGRCNTPAVPGKPPSDFFCRNPPTDFVDLDIYKGIWFQIYGSGSALRFSGTACTTANYELNKNGTVAVLNCSVREKGAIPSCARAVASPRKDTKDTGKLEVFFPSSPPSPANPGRYNVAALLGSNTFYLAAAVYSCSSIPGVPNQSGFFILSRTTIFKELILSLLKLRLWCKGYDTSQMFKIIDQDNCKYFFDDSGFNTQE